MTISPSHVGLEAVRAQNLKLDNAVAKMMSEIYQPDLRIVPASYEVDNGSTDRFILVQGVWVETYPGMRMMMIDDAEHCNRCILGTENPGCKCTRLLCEAVDGVVCPRHFHNYDETITVISGEVIEHETGMAHPLRRPTDRITYPAGQWHRPGIKGLVMICWQPPLDKWEMPPNF